MADLGNYAAVFTVDTTGFNSGIDKAVQKMQAMDAAAAKAGAAGSVGMNGMTEAANKSREAFAGIGSELSGLGSAFPALGLLFSPLTLGAASVAGLVGSLAGGIEKLADMGKTARRVGMDISEFSGLVAISGGNVEELGSSLTKLNRHLGEARRSFEAGDKFREVGLDPDKMSTTSDAIDETFKRYNELANAADRAAVMQVAFSRAGEEMAKVYDRAGGSLEKLHAMMKEHAQDPSSIQAAEKDAHAWHEVSMALDDMGKKLSGAAAKAAYFLMQDAALVPREKADEAAKPAADVVAAKADAAKKGAGVPDNRAATAGVKVLELNRALQYQIELFGQTTDTVDRYKAAQDGADKTIVAFNQELNEQLRLLNQQKNVWEEVGKVIEDTKSPIEKLEDQMMFLDAQFDELGPDRYFKKIAQLGSSLLGSMGTGQAAMNPAAEGGSREASQAIFQHQMNNMSTQERMAMLLDQINVHERELVEQGKTLASLLAKRENPIVVGF